MKWVHAALLGFLFVVPRGPASAAESLQQVFDKVASVYGPAPVAIRERGTTFSVLQGEGTLLRLYKFPDRFHIEIKYADANEDRTMIGGRVWNRRAPADPMSRGAIVLQAARIALPWSMLSRQSTAVDLGAAVGPDGKAVRAIEVPIDAQRKVVVEIDPESGHIVRSRGVQTIGDKVIEFSTVYSDFRVEDGRVHAAREEQSASGTKIGYSIIDRIEYLDALPDSAFAPWQSAGDMTGVVNPRC